MGMIDVFIGFDYGTANCSIAVMQDGAPRMLMMENGSTLLPSMLSAPTRESVSEWLYRHHRYRRQAMKPRRYCAGQ